MSGVTVVPAQLQQMKASHVRLCVSSHCVERFQLRVRPALDVSRAHEELSRLLPTAVVQGTPPSWLSERLEDRPDAYLLIGEDLVCPLRRTATRNVYVAVTCLVRDAGSPAARARRRRRRIRTK